MSPRPSFLQTHFASNVPRFLSSRNCKLHLKFHIPVTCNQVFILSHIHPLKSPKPLFLETPDKILKLHLAPVFLLSSRKPRGTIKPRRWTCLSALAPQKTRDKAKVVVMRKDVSIEHRTNNKWGKQTDRPVVEAESKCPVFVAPVERPLRGSVAAAGFKSGLVCGGTGWLRRDPAQRVWISSFWWKKAHK